MREGGQMAPEEERPRHPNREPGQPPLRQLRHQSAIKRKPLSLSIGEGKTPKASMAAERSRRP